MKITQFDTFLVNSGLRNYLFIRLTTDRGLSGIGEASLEWQEKTVETVLHEWVKDRIVGEDPFDIERIAENLIRDQYQGGSTVLTAISGVEVALWDLVAKACGQPLYKILGGRTKEFDQKMFGHEVRLRTILLEMLVRLLRWEEEIGKQYGRTMLTTSWIHVEKALRYLREHYAEEIYARDLARVAGVSESRLKALFQVVLGMPWSRYLQGYRIHRAAGSLSEPGHNVLEVALSVGFESLSHFNATFRSVMGVSPSVYAKRAAGKTS
ncbi:MAG: helix-turn-helix domain-containing protein [Verrucomicrobia bacterium]|nr:helix-turn-helix domain-containing protein [Verrucomicrobiota bacterium]